MPMELLDKWHVNLQLIGWVITSARPFVLPFTSNMCGGGAYNKRERMDLNGEGGNFSSLVYVLCRCFWNANMVWFIGLSLLSSA